MDASILARKEGGEQEMGQVAKTSICRIFLYLLGIGA
jgi:hypothetical protein